MFEENRFENLLKSLRVRKGKVWTQAKTAKLLGVSLRTYVGWENGESPPSQRDLKNIAATFELKDADTEMLFHAAGQAAPKVQNLPFPPNPLFTGREALLKDLDQLFQKNESVTITQPISISGLGGIGKTQLALEYAHRSYPSMYRCVLWVNAANRVTLEAGYLSLAHLLELPEKDERTVDRIVQAVKTWLEKHTGWLLVLDNADDLQLARSFLPTQPGGNILFTTRSPIVGNIAARIEVEAMEPEEGLSFLLRRSGVLKGGTKSDAIASDIRDVARQLVQLLGGHPLALDQAGAYIEETPAAFATYLQLYSDQRLNLLKKRGTLEGEHPETVVVTFEISFQQARERYPAAADVLHFCAFLHPDDIPEELFSQNDGLTLSISMLNDAIAALWRYSLIKRNVEKKTLSVHRLVQAVVGDTLLVETRQQWKQRAVQAVSAARPDVQDVEQWEACEQWVPHVLVCATWIKEEHLDSEKNASLLNRAAYYLDDRARYREAEPLYLHALAIYKRLFGAEHPATANCGNNLALLYMNQKKYDKAEPLYLHALKICEQWLEAEYPDTPLTLIDQAVLSMKQRKYTEAKPLLKRALANREQELGAMHPDTAQSLNNLGSLYMDQEQYDEAEPLYLHALKICEQWLGADHPDTTLPLIDEGVLALNNLGVLALNNLALLYIKQRKDAQAEPLYLRALKICEQRLRADHLNTARILNNLGVLYMEQRKYAKAEPLLKRALAIRKQVKFQHPDTAETLYYLATLYERKRRYAEAEPLMKQSLAMYEHTLGPEHPITQKISKNSARLLQKNGGQ